MMYKDALCKFQKPEDWGAKSGIVTDSPMKGDEAATMTSVYTDGCSTPSANFNCAETNSVTNSVRTSRFDDMDSWVDDDQCFLDSLQVDLAQAQQQVQQQAQLATWKKVEAPAPHFNRGGNHSHHHNSHHGHHGGRGRNGGGGSKGGNGGNASDKSICAGGKSGNRSAQGSRSDNGPFALGVAPLSASRFDALAPLASTKRFR